MALGLLVHCGGSDRAAPFNDLFEDAGPPVPPEPCTLMGAACDGQTPYRCVAGGPAGGCTLHGRPALLRRGRVRRVSACGPAMQPRGRRAAPTVPRRRQRLAASPRLQHRRGRALHQRPLRRPLRRARRRAGLPRLRVLGDANPQQPARSQLPLRGGPVQPADLPRVGAHLRRRPRRAPHGHPRPRRGAVGGAALGGRARAGVARQPRLPRGGVVPNASARAHGHGGRRRVPPRGDGARGGVSVQPLDLLPRRGLPLVHQRRVAAPVAARAHAALPRADGPPTGRPRRG
jgi:hypothetical protein